ncbi:hypothetical protein L1987_43512 [Smallanthus sonchifolius]|uniref:Uncharacterized protein n=1 Tax=Smallanthus sonchifolius TaxID=185202 RepID=A0ACB9GMX8_9ASTR|nr:hypothetical protein L1987_43512 [Smallanthus sonchifolius]
MQAKISNNMVEQMVSSNLSKYGLGKCASIITTATSEVRDAQNGNKSRPVSSFVKEAQAKSLSGTSSGNVNCNLVYARRKYDAELSNSDKNQTTFQQAAGDKKESFAQNSIAAATTTRTRNCENDQTMEHWNARFAQLHNYLYQYDNSNQLEVYVQKLRSFSRDECNRHAVELERRTIQLTVQEGIEIKRVNDLNVLGKSAVLQSATDSWCKLECIV